jgi:hypothetical protein
LTPCPAQVSAREALHDIGASVPQGIFNHAILLKNETLIKAENLHYFAALEPERTLSDVEILMNSVWVHYKELYQPTGEYLNPKDEKIYFTSPWSIKQAHDLGTTSQFIHATTLGCSETLLQN